MRGQCWAQPMVLRAGVSFHHVLAKSMIETAIGGIRSKKEESLHPPTNQVSIGRRLKVAL